MKTFTTILIFLCAILMFATTHFFMKSNDSDLDLKKIRKQNDSLLNVIEVNNKKIDSIHNYNEVMFAKNDSLKNKMYLTNKKAEKYKKQHEEDINYINSLSDNDIAKLFADKFND